MFGGMDKRQMEKMMKQLGIKSEELDAAEVIIKTRGKDIIISQPQVTKVNMGGTETFQIAGKVTERAAEAFSKDDIDMVMEQTGASEHAAREALRSEGDLAKAILKLKK
ncbi:MAG: nascent polypeptide-associated complex protein [Candidatus Aenigmatarchaeota archaeon]